MRRAWMDADGRCLVYGARVRDILEVDLTLLW